MNFSRLASLALVAPILLTGCASSPSMEKQTKLIEYEKCLEHLENELREVQKQLLETRAFREARTLDTLDRRLTIILGKGTNLEKFEKQIERCAPYRP